MRVDIFFDGACSNNSDNPVMGIGVAVFINKMRQPVFDVSEGLGHGTSNVAEYRALLAALEVANMLYKQDKSCRIYVFGDSQLVVNHVNGDWLCNALHLKPLLEEVLEAMAGTVVNHISWVPRERNKEADLLSKVGIIKAFGKQSRQKKIN